METTEHIAEVYVRHVLGWFTNSNIKAKAGKEIDILAVDKNGRKYHIECGVTHKKAFALKARKSDDDIIKENKKTKTTQKWRHRNSIDFFVKEKFNHSKVKERLKDFGFINNYKKIIVVWQVADEAVHEYAKSKKIEIWELKEKVRDIMKSSGETYYSDDILRTLQLVTKVNNESKKEVIKSLCQIVNNRDVRRKIKQEVGESF